MMGGSFRSWLRTFALLTVYLLGASLSAQGAEIAPELIAAAKKEGRVAFYTPLIVDQIVRPLTAAFRAKYGIQVDYARMDSDAVVLKIINEYRAGRASADVFTTSLGISALTGAGAIRKFKSAMADELPVQYRDPNGYWAADRLYVLGTAVNTDLVPLKDAPKNYDDLLQPKWTGKIVWRQNNLTGASGFIGNVLTNMGEEKGMDYLRKLARQRLVVVNVSDRAMLDQIVAGEYGLTIAMTNHNVAISRKEGAPVAWIPIEPAIVFFDQMGLTTLGPHPNAAQLFLEFTLSREGQEIFRKIGYIPARPDVPPLDPKLLPVGGGFKANVFSPEFVEKNHRHWDEVYRQLFR